MISEGPQSGILRFSLPLPLIAFLGPHSLVSSRFNVMRLSSETLPWPRFSSLQNEGVRLAGLRGPFWHQPCPMPQSISWRPGQILTVTQVGVSCSCAESSSLPPLSVGTSARPALVCIRLGNPGGSGSTYLTFRDRNVLLVFPFSGVLPI